MKNSNLSFARFAVADALAGCAVALHIHAQPAAPFTARLSRESFFPQRLVWVGELPPNPVESQLLWELLDDWRASGGREYPPKTSRSLL